MIVEESGLWGQSWIVRGVAGWCRERPSLVAGPALKFSL